MDHPSGSPSPVVLAQLYGHEHHLSQVLARLRTCVQLLKLPDPNGIDKTVLALHLAQVQYDPAKKRFRVRPTTHSRTPSPQRELEQFDDRARHVVHGMLDAWHRSWRSLTFTPGETS